MEVILREVENQEDFPATVNTFAARTGFPESQIRLLANSLWGFLNMCFQGNAGLAVNTVRVFMNRRNTQASYVPVLLELSPRLFIFLCVLSACFHCALRLEFIYTSVSCSESLTK